MTTAAAGDLESKEKYLSYQGIDIFKTITALPIFKNVPR